MIVLRLKVRVVCRVLTTTHSSHPLSATIYTKGNDRSFSFLPMSGVVTGRLSYATNVWCGRCICNVYRTFFLTWCGRAYHCQGYPTTKIHSNVFCSRPFMKPHFTLSTHMQNSLCPKVPGLPYSQAKVHSPRQHASCGLNPAFLVRLLPPGRHLLFSPGFLE